MGNQSSLPPNFTRITCPVGSYLDVSRDVRKSSSVYDGINCGSVQVEGWRGCCWKDFIWQYDNETGDATNTHRQCPANPRCISQNDELSRCALFTTLDAYTASCVSCPSGNI